MSLYAFFIILLSIETIYGGTLNIGFLHFPDATKTKTSKAVFGKYLETWNTDNPDMQVTIKGDGNSYSLSGNKDVIKSLVEVDKVDVIFGFCYGIDKIDDDTLDEYMNKKGVYIFCASTQDDACFRNVINAEDGGIYYSRPLLYLTSIWKKIVIVAETKEIGVIQDELGGICETQKCKIIKEIDTVKQSDFDTQITSINDDDFLIIVSTSPFNNAKIYSAIKTLKTTNNKNVQSVSYGNLELGDAVTTAPDAAGTLVMSLLSHEYNSDKATEMHNLFNSVIPSGDVSYSQPFHILYLVYILFIINLYFEYRYTLVDIYFTAAKRYQTFNLPILLNNLYIKSFESPISISSLIQGNVIRNSQYLYELSSTADSDLIIKEFTDFDDFSYISTWDRIGKLPVGNCDWTSSPTNGISNGSYVMIILIIPYSDEYENVGVYYSRIINSYIHEMNKDGGILHRTIISYYIDSLSEYSYIKNNLTMLLDKYDVSLVMYNTPYETRMKMLNDFSEKEILWFNLHNNAGYECKKFHYNLAFSHEQISYIHFLAFDLAQEVKRNYTFVYHSETEEDTLIANLYIKSLEEQGTMHKQFKYPIDNITDELTAAYYGSLVVVSLNFEDTIQFLNYLNNTPVVVNNIRVFFINTYEPVFDKYKDTEMMKKIYLLTPFSENKESNVMSEMKQLISNYYKFNETELIQPIYGFMGLAYVGLKIWNTTVVLINSLNIPTVNENIYKRHISFVQGPYSIDITGYSIMDVVLEKYNNDTKQYEEIFSTDFAIVPYAFDNNTMCDLTRVDEPIYNVVFLKIFGMYTFHNKQSRNYLSQLKLVVALINQKGGFNGFMLKLEYSTSPAYIIPKKVISNLNSGIKFYVGADNNTNLDLVIPEIEKKKAFLINPHYFVGKECYSYIIHTGLMASQIFSRMIEVSGVQGTKLVAVSSGSREEDEMIESLEKYANDEYSKKVIIIRKNETTDLDVAIDEGLIELSTTECSRVTCTVVALTQDTIMELLNSISKNNLGTKFGAILLSPFLNDIVPIFDKMKGTIMAVDSYFYKLTNSESRHFVQDIEQTFGPSYIVTGVTMAMYEGLKLIEKAFSVSNSNTNMDEIQRALLNLEYKSPSGTITLKPNLNVERKVYIGMIKGVMVSGNSFNPSITNENSNSIYPMFGNTNVYCDWSDDTILDNGTYSQIKILLLNDPDTTSRNLAISGYLKEIIEKGKLPETIHYQGIITRANCPTTELEASTVLIKYSYQDYMITICDCPITSLEKMDVTLATIDMVFFYIRPSLRSKCSNSIWYMDITPIQHLRPTLFWAFEKFGTKVSVVYNNDFDVSNYLTLIDELSNELKVPYKQDSLTDDDSTYKSIILNQLQFIQDEGFIIDLLPEELSKKYHKVYTTLPDDIKILTFFSYTLGMMEVNLMKNQYFITTSYPSAVKDTEYLENAVPYMSLSFYTPPNVLLAAEALNAIIHIYQTYQNPTIQNFKNGLIGYEMKDFEGTIKFDSSHYINRPVYAVEVVRNPSLSYEIIQISMNWLPDPFFLAYNSDIYNTCDLTQSNTLFEKDYIKIGVIQSFTGDLADYSRGLAAVITSLCGIINEQGGINGYYINPLVKNDESLVSKITTIINSFKRHDVTYVFGITDSSIRIEALSVIEKQNMLLYYPANTEAHECSRNIFSTGMMINDLLSLPYLLRSNFSATKVYMVVMNSDKAKFEVQLLQERFEMFGIKLVGKYFVYTKYTNFDRVASIISNSLGTNGIIVSLLKGSLAMEFFQGCYGIIKSTMQIIATGINEDDLNNSGYGYTALGHYIWLNYVRPEKTSKYYTFYEELNKKMTYKTSFNELHANTYNAFELWINSVKKAGSFKLEDVIKAGEGLEFDSISGSLKMDTSHYLYGRGTINKVEFDKNENKYVLTNVYPNIMLNYKTFAFSIFDENEVRLCDWSKEEGDYKPNYVKIGLLYDLTGTNSEYELISGMSAISAILTINEEGGILDGIYVIPVLRNTKSDSLIPTIVNEFIKDPKIIAIVGGKSEEARALVKTALEQANSDLLFFTPAKNLGNECNLDVVQIGSTMNQFCDPILNYILASNAIPEMYIIEGETGISDVFKAILLEQYKPFVQNIRVIMGNDASISSMEVVRTVFNAIPERGLIFSLLTTNYHLQLLDQIRNDLHIDLTKYYFFGLVPDTKDTMTNPQFENTYFFISYDIFSENPKNIKLLDQWLRHSLTTFLSEDAYNSYLAIEYIKAAIEKGQSTDVNDLKNNLIDLKLDSPNGEIEILSNLYSSHHINIGYMNSERKFITNGASVNAYEPVAFLWYDVNTMGYECDVRTGSDQKVPKDFGFLLYCTTTTGIYSSEDSDIPIVLSQLVQDINRNGGILGKRIIIQYFDDKSDEETCGSRLYDAIEDIQSRLIGIIYGGIPSCLTGIKSSSQKYHIPIFVYTYTQGETCEANVIYFDVEPSFLERAYQMFLTRNYIKYAVIGGLAQKYAHVKYASVYLSNLFQNVSIIGNITEDNIEDISKGIKSYLGEENSIVLYFGIDAAFHPLLDTFSEKELSLYHFVAFGMEEKEGDYNYDLISTYINEIENEQNNAMISKVQEFLHKKPTSVISKLYSIVSSFEVMVKKSNTFSYVELFEAYRQNDIVTPEGILKLSSSNYVMFYMRIAEHTKDGIQIVYTSTDLINPNPYKYLINEEIFYVCTITKAGINKKLPKNKYNINVIIHFDKNREKSISTIEGVVLAQTQINAAGGTLNYYIAVKYYNLDSPDSLAAFQASIRLTSNVYIVGFTTTVLLKNILVYLNNSDEVFFSSSTLTEGYCVENLITTETTGPQISKFLVGAVIQIKAAVYLICDKDTTSESYLITTKYIKPTFEYYGIEVFSLTEVDKGMTDLTQFWANSEMIKIRVGIIISTVGDVFDLHLLKTFKDQGFEGNDIHLLFTNPINEFFIDDSLVNDLQGHFASGSFMNGIQRTERNDEIDIAIDAEDFINNINNNFGGGIAANSVSESAYTSVYYIHNTITFTRSTDVRENVASLSEVVIQSPSGKILLDKSKSLARRLFVIQFTSNGPYLYYSPDSLTHTSFYSDYYNLTNVEICSFNPMTSKIIKNVIVLHIISPDTVNEETSIARTIDLFELKIETDFELNGYDFNFYNIYSNENDIEEDLSKAIDKYNPVAILGGRQPFLLPIVEKLTQNTATPYFYYGLDDTSICRRNFFYFQSDYYQRFDIANQYIMNLTFTDSVIVYDSEIDNILDDFKKLFDKNKSPLLAAINITTKEGIESIQTVLPSLLATKLSHIAVYVLVQGKKENSFREYVMKYKKILSNSNFLFIFKECNPFYWTDEQYSFFNGHVCIDTLSNNEDSTESTVFRTEAYNVFGNNRGDSEINSLVYSSLILLGNAINNVMVDYTENKFPSADYINQALKQYHMRIPNGQGKIANSGILITTYYVKSISQYGFDSVEYPTNGLIYIDPQVDCNLGKLVKIYTYPDSLIASYLVYVIVVLYLLSVFYFYTRNRKNPIVRNTSYLFSVIAMFALFLLATCSMIVLIHPKNDFTCGIRKWLILISLDLLLSTFVMKVWRIHKLMNNKQLNKMRISDGRLLMVIGGVIAVQLVYLLIWTLADPVHHHKELNSKLSDFVTDVYVRNCDSETYFLIPQTVGILALAGWGIQVAFKIRTVVAEFNESLSLISTISILCIWTIVMVVLDFVLSDDPTGLAFIRTMGMNVGVFVVAFLQFGNKVSLLYCAHQSDGDDDSSSSSEGEKNEGESADTQDIAGTANLANGSSNVLANEGTSGSSALVNSIPLQIQPLVNKGITPASRKSSLADNGITSPLRRSQIGGATGAVSPTNLRKSLLKEMNNPSPIKIRTSFLGGTNSTQRTPRLDTPLEVVDEVKDV